MDKHAGIGLGWPGSLLAVSPALPLAEGTENRL